MDIIKFYEDYKIPYKTEGHKHCRPGWVNVPCPFCTGNPGYHLGYPLEGGPFVCWRCGPHTPFDTVKKLLSLRNRQEVNQILIAYKGKAVTISRPQNVKKKPFSLPSNSLPLTKKHKNYLIKRGFDPEYLIKHWHILGTGPISYLYDKEQDKKISYKHRIVVPIYWNREMVSFQTRDVTDKSEVKYIACPINWEILHHKHILYANPINWEKMQGGTGIIVEGVTDVWKLGDFATATFGIKYKPKQADIIGRHFDRVIILFDDDPEAQKQARKLQEDLISTYFLKDVHIEPIKNDPGSLSQEDARHLSNQLLTKIYQL